MKRLAQTLTMVVTLMMPVAWQYANAASGTTDKPAAQSPPAAVTPQQPSSLSGKVLDAKSAGSYSYIYLEKKNGEKQWVALPAIEVAVGDQVDLSPGMEMKNFNSKALNRTFDSIIFSDGPITQQASTGKEEVKDAKEEIKKAHEGSMSADKKQGIETQTENIKVDKASGPNAYTVGELFQKKGELNGKNVIVKAKVVKVSQNIMDRNWLHLRDGSGDATKGTHDLTVTTKELPKVGDIITVSGNLAKDKDLGAGYKYEVIMEDASIKP